MIYLVCFALSVFFAYLAKKAQNRINFIVFSILSIAVTTLLAGLRDITIGIDTSNYYVNTWSKALILREYSLWEYLQLYIVGSRGRVEVLFALLVGIVARITADYQVFLTLVHLIIVSCVYIGAFRMRKHAEPDFVMLLFYLLYYNYSLNISRQYIAMAIVFAAVADIERGKFFRYIVFTLIAFLFHNTGIIGLAPMLVYLILYPRNQMKNVTMLRKITACVIIVGAVFAFVPMVRVLINMGILSRKYLYYLNSDQTSSYKLVFVFLFTEIIGVAIFWRNFQKYDRIANFFLFCSISFVLLYELATMIAYGKRVAAYFSLLNIVSLGILEKCPRLAGNKIIVRTGIVVVLLIYWIYVFFLRNASETVPYIFCFQF